MADGDSIKDRLTRQGEDALGKLAQDLLENPLVSGALTRAFEARERAVQAQVAAMGALNLPSAADIERLTRRLRSVAQRLEGIEDGVDRLDQRLAAIDAAQVTMAAAPTAAEQRLAAIEGQLAKLLAEVAQLSAHLDAGPAPVHRAQESLPVASDPLADDTAPPAPSRRGAAPKEPVPPPD